MTSSGNGPLTDSPTTSSFPNLDVKKTRSPTADGSPETSATSPPLRTSSPASLISRTPTLSGFLSRSESPNGRLSLSLAKFGRSASPSPLGNIADDNDEIRTLIVRAFSPTVGIYVSTETDDLARKKGLKDGFVELLQPFGERVAGKVVVRDSVGASRSWEDFGVRFISLNALAKGSATTETGPPLDTLEELLEQYLEEYGDGETGTRLNETSPYYRLLLSRLLSSQSPSTHEAFLHPVASIIAISSSTPSPIETLRNLYSQTAQGSCALPPHANPEYLRYYVLVHDDDRDDFAKSSALFDQMKRHFGLHCHLLRLRSAFCTSDDEDGEALPPLEWLTISSELSKLQETAQLIDIGAAPRPHIYSSDVAALKTFVRELVAQSVVPYMEQRIATWNEQIASRRRGISGRFMSLSKRWGGISSLASSRSSSSLNSSSNPGSGNYDPVQGLYRWDTPEALLRKMADFACMLRDYKLASSTYELLRSDYNNDKAWKYLAGANEMCGVSYLLNPLLSSTAAGSSTSSSGSGKSLPKLETFDQMLESASYSYLTRCDEPALALRAVLVYVELLRVRGRLAAELAAKWAVRSLEFNIVPSGSVSHVLIGERVANCLTGLSSSSQQRQPASYSIFGQRKRKAAMWSVTSADEWMKLGRAEFAAARLDEATELYNDLKYGTAIKDFAEMSEFMDELQLAVRMKLGQGQGRRQRGASGASATGHLIEPISTGVLNSEGKTEVRFVKQEVEETTEEQMESLDRVNKAPGRRGHGHKRTMTNPMSVVGGGDMPGPSPMAPPLSPVRLNRPDPFGAAKVDDDFE